ncbi:MAG: Uma2 family endonuclease [Prochloraceae cyanobacterium]|nr:Uma2 family endonuclease [Prochloraceae cyanobacterium]
MTPNSTEAFDRGDKFADYQELASLQEYVLINTKKQRIECFRRSDFQKWILEFYTEDKNSFELKSIDFKGKLETIYEDVNFESV